MRCIGQFESQYVVFVYGIVGRNRAQERITALFVSVRVLRVWVECGDACELRLSCRVWSHGFVRACVRAC